MELLHLIKLDIEKMKRQLCSSIIKTIVTKAKSKIKKILVRFPQQTIYAIMK